MTDGKISLRMARPPFAFGDSHCRAAFVVLFFFQAGGSESSVQLIGSKQTKEKPSKKKQKNEKEAGIDRDRDRGLSQA